MPRISIRQHFRKLRSKSRNRGLICRRGVEAVEAALTLPLLLALVFPMLHLTHNWHTEKMLKIAAFEAVKVLGHRDGTLERAQSTFAEYATAFGIEGAELELDPSFLSGSIPTDSAFWVRGVAPQLQNRLPLPLNISLGSQLRSGQVFYRKEG